MRKAGKRHCAWEWRGASRCPGFALLGPASADLTRGEAPDDGPSGSGFFPPSGRLAEKAGFCFRRENRRIRNVLILEIALHTPTRMPKMEMMENARRCSGTLPHS
ncbi:unnamed protein product [Rangifer tarandus platyrhynchus]|uniref:Uncharacterized protein n=1 Tax=Rangifer tarandus platyrhynchus TaxID=3082113 RepID=A0AC59YQN5_RANTA